MPETFTVDVGARIVRGRVWGKFTASELLEHYLKMAADPAFDPAFSQIGDLREVEEFDMGSTAVEAAADLGVFSNASRRALVVARDVQFGIARMYATFSEMAGQNVRVFRDYDAALSWALHET